MEFGILVVAESKETRIFSNSTNDVSKRNRWRSFMTLIQYKTYNRHYSCNETLISIHNLLTIDATP